MEAHSENAEKKRKNVGESIRGLRHPCRGAGISVTVSVGGENRPTATVSTKGQGKATRLRWTHRVGSICSASRLCDPGAWLRSGPAGWLHRVRQICLVPISDQSEWLMGWHIRREICQKPRWKGDEGWISLGDSSSQVACISVTPQLLPGLCFWT